MSYAMSLLKQEISRHMKGECRVDLQTGVLRSMDGDPHESCAECPGYCEGGTRRAGFAGSALQVETIALGEGRVKLAWSCPGCKRETVEDSTALESVAQAKQIEQDPLCHTCRNSATLAKAGAA